VLYSEPIEKVNVHIDQEVSWSNMSKLPILRTPLNDVKLVEERSLLMMIWGKPSGEKTLPGAAPYVLLG